MKNILYTIIVAAFLISCNSKSNEESESDELQRLIGLQITSQPVQNYLNKIGIEPEIFKSESVYFYVFKSKGIEFSISTSDTLRAIHLYSESSDNNRQFQSDIPFGISFNDTRKVVEEKLGPPDSNGGGGLIKFYSNWDKKGISITYKTIDQEDMTNRIHCVTLCKKEN